MNFSIHTDPEWKSSVDTVWDFGREKLGQVYLVSSEIKSNTPAVTDVKG